MVRTKRQKKEKRQRQSARRRAEEHSTAFDRTTFRTPDGMKLFSPKSGKYNIDIVEYRVGKGNKHCDEGLWYHERSYFCHPRIGMDENSHCCPKMIKSRCPVCDERTKEVNKADGDSDLIKSLRPRERQLFLVYVHEEADKGLQLMDISFYCFGELLDKEVRNSDEEDGYEDFASTDEDGMTLRVVFEDETFPGGGKPFPKVSTINFRQRKEDVPQEVIDQVVCLDDLLIVPDYDKLKAIFLQLDSDDEEEEDKPTPKKRGNKKPDPEPEDDEEEEPWDSDDEEEEDKPTPKKRGKKKPDPEPEPEDEDEDEDEDWDDDDDDEDEDEDDDDEPEEKPKKRRGRGRK